MNDDGLPGDDLNTGRTGTDVPIIRTFTTPAGFTYTIKLSNVKVYNRYGTDITTTTNGVLRSVKSNDWSGNNFPSAYDFDNERKKIIGLTQRIDRNQDRNRATLTLEITSTFPSGETGIPKGIVIAGTESLMTPSDLTQQEWYSLTVGGEGSIRMIDKYILGNNWNNISLNVTKSADGKTVKVINPTKDDSRGDVMLLATNTGVINAEVKGAGAQHFAIGFIEELDYSDAPASYGNAYHTVLKGFTEDKLVAGQTTIIDKTSNTADVAASNPNGQLAKYSAPQMVLGNDIDDDAGPMNVPAGTRPDLDDRYVYDTSTIATFNDEDAIQRRADGSPPTINGYLMSIKFTNHTDKAGYIHTWVDKDRSGTFDANELVTTPVPANKVGNIYVDLRALGVENGDNYYTRLRYTTLANIGPIGYAPDGEVEDHWINYNSLYSEITGQIFEDQLRSFRNPQGNPYENVMVQLLDETGNIATNVYGDQMISYTDITGRYVFSGLENKSYRVRVVLPNGYFHSNGVDQVPYDGLNTVTISTQGRTSNINFGILKEVCYIDANTAGAGLPTIHGITTMQRAGVDNGNWPMVRTGAWTVLESNTKGFVITRVDGIPADVLGKPGQPTTITNPQEGMMIYDIVNKCLKIYDGTIWSCFSTPTCQ